MVLYPFPPVAPSSSSLPSVPWSTLIRQPSAHILVHYIMYSMCDGWQRLVPLSTPVPLPEQKVVTELLRASQVHL